MPWIRAGICIRLNNVSHTLRRFVAGTLLSGGVFCGPVHGSPAEPASPSLADLSLEELSRIEITSVSKRAQRLSDAAASVFVITAEDIRRTGVRSLPEALRLAPNLQVAQVNANGFAISARGFNSNSANKLLVLIDGRSVYTPLFSGVFWDVQDLLLEDIERIEVISGPGGTLWGVNAVNGVINVITRSAIDTQGVLLAAGTGNRNTDAGVRVGKAYGADAGYRVYGKYSEIYHTETASGAAKDDAMHKSQAGFRADWSRAGDTLSVHGNAYRGREGQPPPGSITITGIFPPLDAISVSGANVTAQWNRALDGGGQFALRETGSVRPAVPAFAAAFRHPCAGLGCRLSLWT